jgi:hypothetical protein
MSNMKRCFVIMPFSETNENHTTEYWARHFSSYLKPLIESVKGLEAFRSEPLRGNIASQIITDLTNSDIVVADLTDHNPNVLWELGVRQSFKHGTITIAETGTKIPFHFSHKGILFYNGDHLDNEDFEDQFKKSLRDCIKRPEKPDSPVLETLGGRGTLYGIVHKEENQRRIQALQTELKINEKLLETISACIKKNKAFRKNHEICTMPSRFFKFSAIDFLHVNRYLDKDNKFYENINIYLNHIMAHNRHLEEWWSYPIDCEDWFSKNYKMLAKIIKDLKEILKASQ